MHNQVITGYNQLCGKVEWGVCQIKGAILSKICVSSKCWISHGIIFCLPFTDGSKAPFFVTPVPWGNCYKVLFCFYPFISKKIIFKQAIIQMSKVTPCIATQNLHTARKENWTCEDIYKQVNLESKQNFTICMKIFVSSHNLPHLNATLEQSFWCFADRAS